MAVSVRAWVKCWGGRAELCKPRLSRLQGTQNVCVFAVKTSKTRGKQLAIQFCALEQRRDDNSFLGCNRFQERLCEEKRVFGAAVRTSLMKNLFLGLQNLNKCAYVAHTDIFPCPCVTFRVRLVLA